MAEGKVSQQELVAQWEAVQVKTFTKWVNSHLNKRAIAVDNVRTAFQDGVNLIHLLEIISDETLPRKNLNPKMKIHKVENVGTAMTTFPLLRVAAQNQQRKRDSP
jgi:hypothetical protein